MLSPGWRNAASVIADIAKFADLWGGMVTMSLREDGSLDAPALSAQAQMYQLKANFLQLEVMREINTQLHQLQVANVALAQALAETNNTLNVVMAAVDGAQMNRHQRRSAKHRPQIITP